MGISLDQSYAQCRSLVNAASSSFALGMRLFPEDRRDGVYAVYAFFRITDDLVDQDGPPEAKRAALAAWREQVLTALAGGGSDLHEVLVALADTVRRHQLPESLFAACVDACAGDIGPVSMADWDELLSYCDGVAGTVGEACLRILGYRDAAVLQLSQLNARAVQLTNILRDLDEDWRRQRVYIPAEVLSRHGANPENLGASRYPPELTAALAEVAERAVAAYRGAEPLFEHLAPAHRPAVTALTLRYRLMLERLQALNFQTVGRYRPGIGDRVRVFRDAMLSQRMPTWRR